MKCHFQTLKINNKTKTKTKYIYKISHFPGFELRTCAKELE